MIYRNILAIVNSIFFGDKIRLSQSRCKKKELHLIILIHGSPKKDV